MKILYLIHQFYPDNNTGTEKIFLNLAKMMQKYGHKVEVITYSFNKDSFYDQSKASIVFKEFVYQGIPVLAFRHKRIPEDINQALEDKDLSKVASYFISRKKPDVVHMAHPMRVFVLGKALQSLNIPYIVTLTDFFLICPKYTLITSKNTLCSGPERGRACQNLCPEFPTDLITRRLETAREILFNAKVVTSLSGFQASLFEKEFPGLAIKVVNPGLRYSVLKNNRRIYRKGYEIVFGYAGSLNAHKGIDILIDAFKKIVTNNVVLKIYGSGPKENYVKAVAEEDRRILFCGVYSDHQLGEVMAGFDVVIVPSLWYETYCLVMHEAFACGVPVIASDVGLMAEKIKKDVNGFSFRMGDSEDLREVLQKVADNPTILNTLRHNINRIATRSVEQEAYTYERVYVQIRSGIG